MPLQKMRNPAFTKIKESCIYTKIRNHAFTKNKEFRLYKKNKASCLLSCDSKSKLFRFEVKIPDSDFSDFRLESKSGTFFRLGVGRTFPTSVLSRSRKTAKSKSESGRTGVEVLPPLLKPRIPTFTKK